MIPKHLTGKRGTGLLHSCDSLCNEQFCIATSIMFFTSGTRFVWKHPDLSNLTFPPLEWFATSHKDYLQVLKDKAAIIASIMLDYKTQLSHDRVKNASKVKNIFRRRFVIMLAHHASSTERHKQILTGLHRVSVYWCSIRFYTLKLKDLENRVLLDTFHINRLK